MYDQLRLSLVMQASGGVPGDRASYQIASVQVWRGEVHITTIELLDLVEWSAPEQGNHSTIEHYATVAARALARALEDAAMLAVEKGVTHSLHDIRREFPRVESSQGR